MPKVKVPGSWRLSVGSWRVSVGSWRLSVVPCLYLSVPGGYLPFLAVACDKVTHRTVLDSYKKEEA